MSQSYKRTRLACFSTYLSMASVFVLPPMLFMTFHTQYGISYTLLGTTVLLNFCTQLAIDLIFTFFSQHFNIRAMTRLMPLLTTVGLVIYALSPLLFPKQPFIGLALGTLIFSVAAGLSEVLISPLIAACPSEKPERDMSLLHSLYGWGVILVVLISSIYFYFFTTKHWTYLALFFAVLPLITCFLFFTSPTPSTAPADSSGSGKARRGRGLALCVLCIFLGSCAENAMTNWISSYMEGALQLPKSVGDLLGLAMFALLLATGRVLYAKFTPGIEKTLLFGMVGATACYWLAGLSPSLLLSFFSCILMGLFTSMLWPGTLILMEEKIPAPGLAAYALMAAGGDLGASLSPQLLGLAVDKISASRFAADLSLSTSMTVEEIGMRAGMLTVSIFPAVGIVLLLAIVKKTRKAAKAAKTD